MAKSDLFIDKRSIMQVLGCLITNPNLFERTDKYNLNIEDFGETFHKTIFGTVANLKQQGLKEINVVDIDNYLSSRPTLYKVFNSNNGAEYINEITKLADRKKFDYYYNRIKKMTLLRMYMNYGVDVTWLYNPDCLDLKVKQQQEDWFETSDLSTIAAAIDDKIEEIKSHYLDTVGENGFQAGANIFELIEELKTTPEVGIPLYGAFINTITRGARLKKFYLRSAATGKGKAIPNDTIIPTPTGYRKVGDIKPGDFLFAQDGTPTKVVQIHPQEEKKQSFKIIFSDGREALCCEDHLWEYQYEGHRGFSTRVESVKDILIRIKSLKNGFKDASNKGYRFRIPMNKAVEYGEKAFSIPPYVLGLLLGDGSFRYNTRNKALTFSSENEELPKAIAEICNWNYKKNGEKNYNYTFEYKEPKEHLNVWVEDIFKDYQELWNVLSQDKFIPSEYLQGSIEQRYDLLAGLLDTDGFIHSDKGKVSFCSTSSKLVNDVVELCHSLGFVTSIKEDKRKDKYTDKCWNVSIQCKKELKPKLFKLERKRAAAIEYANNGKRSEYKDFLAIVDIVPTNEYVDMTCFTVDNERCLFLMNDFIVTHNTRSMIADACTFSCEQIYDLYLQKWIKHGAKEPTLFITTEQEKAEIQTMMLAFLSGVQEENILNGKYAEGEEDRVRYAAGLLSQAPLWIKELPDFSIDDIENVIRKYVIDEGVKMVCLDYMHTSLKILEEITRKAGGIKLREDNVLFMLSIRLKDLCNELGIFLISATQLNGDYQGAKNADQNVLRGAKAIADKVDFGCILMPVTEEDTQALEPLLAMGSMVTPNIVMHIYKNRRGKYTAVKLWCSADLGICRLDPIFLTDNDYKLIPIENFNIQVEGD